MLHELFITHCTNSTLIMNPFTIERLLEILSSYSLNLYYIKRKGMILSDFLSRQRHDNSNQHEIIPISFSMQNILHSKYHNIGKEKLGKSLVQTRSQAKSSGISFPEVHDIGKGLDPDILQEKQVLKPIVTST